MNIKTLKNYSENVSTVIIALKRIIGYKAGVVAPYWSLFNYFLELVSPQE